MNSLKNLGKLLSGVKKTPEVTTANPTTQPAAESKTLAQAYKKGQPKGVTIDQVKAQVQSKETVPLTPEQKAEKKFIKREKYYATEGPMLFISKLLLKKGHLNSKQIWTEYIRDPHSRSTQMLKSKTYLKQKILRKMLTQGKIERAGYSRQTNTYLGFRLNPEVAFKNVHPDILLKLDPLPQIKRIKDPDVIFRKNSLGL